MQLVAVTDIFGRTDHFHNMIDHIAPVYDSVEIIDPYDGVDNHFPNEDEAYRHFQKTMGLEKYSGILLQHLHNRKTNKRTVVLGFSIGASAIWAISAALKKTENIQAICFYSSQIRNCLERTPAIAIDLYFAKTEPTYDVDAIIESISVKPHVKCYKTPYLHGFMNKLSKNYNQAGYDTYIKIIQNTYLSD